MEMFSKLIMLFILIVVGFKSDIVEGGRAIKISSQKVVSQPQTFPVFPGFGKTTVQPISPGFPNSDFPSQPGKHNNIPGFSFPDFPGFPNFFGFPLFHSGRGDPPPPRPPGFILPLPFFPSFPFFPYLRYGLPRFCIHYIGCTPLHQPPPCQCKSPQVQPTPILFPPDQPPPAQTPMIQPPPARTSPVQPPLAQIPPFQSPPDRIPSVETPLAQTPAFQPGPISPVAKRPAVQTPRVQSASVQA